MAVHAPSWAMRKLATFIAVCSFLCESETAFAQTSKEVVSLPGAQLFAVTGKVEVGKEGQKPTARSDRGTTAKSVVVLEAKPGEVISTGEGAGASLTLGNGAITGTARLGPDTSVKLPEGTTELHSLELLKGRLFLNINGEQLKQQRQGEFRLKTPAALLAVKGTRFFAVADTQEILGTHEGTVSVTTATGTVLLPAGKILEIKAGVAGQPRQMTPAEANVAGEYAKADLDEIPVHLATPTQKSAIKDGVVFEWGTSKGYKDNPNGMYGAPSGERSEPVLGADGVLRYAFNDPKTQDPKQTHEMQLDLMLRGDARQLEGGTVIAITFLVKKPAWDAKIYGSRYSYPFRLSTASILPATDPNVLKVTYPCGQMTSRRFSELKQKLEVALPEREKGKSYQIEMWDFKVLTRPE